MYIITIITITIITTIIIRSLLASVSIAYTISVISNVDINILKFILESAVLSGSFASSLSSNSGIVGLFVRGIKHVYLY
jgi:hypothetical protein